MIESLRIFTDFISDQFWNLLFTFLNFGLLDQFPIKSVPSSQFWINLIQIRKKRISIEIFDIENFTCRENSALFMRQVSEFEKTTRCFVYKKKEETSFDCED